MVSFRSHNHILEIKLVPLIAECLLIEGFKTHGEFCATDGGLVLLLYTIKKASFSG